MIKKIIASAWVFIALILCSVPCTAETAEQNVYAKYVENEPHFVRSVVKQGKAQVTLPDGTVITVSGIPSDSYVLCVKKITDADKEAMQWFSQCLKDKVKDFCPFDICLLDAENRVVLRNDVDVQIATYKRDYDKLCFLDADGNSSSPSYSLLNRVFSFRSKLNDYCVITVSNSSDETASGVTTSDTQKSSSPQTGDNSYVILWSVMSVCSSSLLVVLLFHRKSPEVNEYYRL